MIIQEKDDSIRHLAMFLKFIENVLSFVLHFHFLSNVSPISREKKPTYLKLRISVKWNYALVFYFKMASHISSLSF